MSVYQHLCLLTLHQPYPKKTLSCHIMDLINFMLGYVEHDRSILHFGLIYVMAVAMFSLRNIHTGDFGKIKTKTHFQ